MIVFFSARFDGNLVDIHVEGGRITEILPSAHGSGYDASSIIDLEGKEIFPLMIDVHAHLREPGQIYKEGLGSGLRAALLNGISRIGMMSNTVPPLDDAHGIRELKKSADNIGYAETNINAAATLSQKGKKTADYPTYPDCVRAISDDGHTIADENVVRKVFEKARENGLVVMTHCEDPSTSGHMQRCETTAALNIPSVTEKDEAVIIKRNIRIAKEIGLRLHICHISSVEGLEEVARAKNEGYPITCEVTHHHLFLSTNDIDYTDGLYKVNPPLRSESTRRHLLRALLDGKIDMIATDHAPHAMDEKRVPIEDACFGFSGFDSLFLNIYTHLIRTGKMDLGKFNLLTSIKPAKLLSVKPETIRVGGDASFMVIDRGKYSLKEEDILSKGKNNPFIGKQFAGRIDMVVKRGEIHKRSYVE